MCSGKLASVSSQNLADLSLHMCSLVLLAPQARKITVSGAWRCFTLIHRYFAISNKVQKRAIPMEHKHKSAFAHVLSSSLILGGIQTDKLGKWRYNVQKGCTVTQSVLGACCVGA